MDLELIDIEEFDEDDLDSLTLTYEELQDLLGVEDAKATFRANSKDRSLSNLFDDPEDI